MTTSADVPRRPALRWHGGKWRLAPRIIEHFPPHRRYVEPFGGAASVLLRKPRAYAEIYNDLNEEVVTLFRVLRDPELGGALIAQLRLTPFARAELEQSYHPSPDPVEIARRLIVRSFQGFGSAGVNGATTGFRANSDRSGTTPAHDWANYPDCVPALIERLQGVVIERKDALALAAAMDREDTLIYFDPPYLPETRSKKRGPQGLYHSYKCDMTTEDHERFLAAVLVLKSMVVISGYASDLYNARLSGWERVAFDARADGARATKEILWINPAAAAAAAYHGKRHAAHHGLFAEL